MEFNFQLPPVTTSSPLHGRTATVIPDSPVAETISLRKGDLAQEYPSSASSLFNIFHSDRDTSLVSDLSSRCHPVFINSDLDSENRIIYECEESYPVDRL